MSGAMGFLKGQGVKGAVKEGDSGSELLPVLGGRGRASSELLSDL